MSTQTDIERLVVDKLIRIEKRLSELEPQEPAVEPPEPEPPENKPGTIAKLVSIFIISSIVLYYCKGWKPQVVYLLISVIMRVVLIWQLPDIIRALGGG